MSLYELASTFQALERRSKGVAKPMSQEDAMEIRDRMAEIFKNDPSVRLH